MNAWSMQVIHPVHAVLADIEREFFAVREGWPRPGWTEEYREAFARLREVGSLLQTELDRADLTFSAQHDFRMLLEYCTWLVRRIGGEIFFRAQLAMEQELKSRSEGAAHDIYLRLVEMHDAEVEFKELGDMELLKSLVAGEVDDYFEIETPSVLQ